jgi:hypothetical protein
MASGLTEDDHLVLIEIGGNDLLTGMSSDDYGCANGVSINIPLESPHPLPGLQAADQML